MKNLIIKFVAVAVFGVLLTLNISSSIGSFSITLGGDQAKANEEEDQVYCWSKGHDEDGEHYTNCTTCTVFWDVEEEGPKGVCTTD